MPLGTAGTAGGERRNVCGRSGDSYLAGFISSAPVMTSKVLSECTDDSTRTFRGCGLEPKSRSFPRQDDDCYLNKEQTPTTYRYTAGRDLHNQASVSTDQLLALPDRRNLIHVGNTPKR